jgi:hypothetical protein
MKIMHGRTDKIVRCFGKTKQHKVNRQVVYVQFEQSYQ